MKEIKNNSDNISTLWLNYIFHTLCFKISLSKSIRSFWKINFDFVYIICLYAKYSLKNNEDKVKLSNKLLILVQLIQEPFQK